MRKRQTGAPTVSVTNCGGILRFADTGVVPVGRFTVTNKSTPIDFLHEPRGSETMIIGFHGAVKPDTILPVFSGKGIANATGANLLAVSDPTLLFSDSLRLAWFAGSAYQNDVQNLIRRVIANVARRTQTKYLIFLGGSGGGFAALDMSRRFPGSLALPMNPQTSIEAHRPKSVKEYLTTAWPDAGLVTNLPQRCVHNQVDAYKQEFNNTVGYIQQAHDVRHIKYHMRPFFNAIGDSPNVWLYEHPWIKNPRKAHSPPPKQWILAMLQRMVRARGDWDRGLAELGFSQAPHQLPSFWSEHQISNLTWTSAIPEHL